MTPELSARVDEFGKASKRSAVFGGLGLTVLITCLLIGAWRLRTADALVRGKEHHVAEIEEQARDLSSQIVQLQVQKEKLTTDNQVLEAEVRRLKGPLADLVELKSSEDPLGIKDADGAALYDYSIWIVVPESRKQEIAEVEYHFKKPTNAIRKKRIATNPSNGYAISYRGWGCFHEIDVTVRLKSGRDPIIKTFNQCTTLGRSESRLP